MIVLDAKTDYSFLRGYGSPQQWLERAKAIGLSALGVADYCSTWGHHPFREAFKGSGVKLLYGVQVPVVSSLEKDPRHSLITLLAKRSTSELYAMMSTAHKQTYYRPRLTWDQVAGLQDCVVIVNELLATHVRRVPASAYVGHKLLPSDALRALTKNPKVLAYSPRYPNVEHRRGFELFEAISENHRLGEIECDDFHLLRDGEARSIFGNDEVIRINQAAIAEQCTAEPPFGKLLDMGVENKLHHLTNMALDGAIHLGLAYEDAGHIRWYNAEYADRLASELQTIHSKNFEDYFFFVADIVAWAKERMFVGPGRGSSGGSLLCYLLGITTVDPLKFGTLFERFIDVTRSDLPDIDVDFPDTRRQEVFDYLRAKYGQDRVARLGTITEFGGKSAFNSVARATNVPFDASREIGKFTEGGVQGQVFPPKWVMKNCPEAEKILKRFPSLRLASLLDETETPDNAANLPQHPSHHGVHASGVVVTDEPCQKFGTVNKDGVLSIDMRTAEKIGLVKMDALGLRTLSVIQETCDLAGIDPKSLYDLDWADMEVFDRVFNADRVTGIFQFEGHAVRTLMRQIKIDNFNDICALSSLARPGPLMGGAAAAWVKARNGEAVGEMLHPALESTYGTLTYQEQFMVIARDIAGFDVAQVNGMRKAVGKKDVAKLRGFREAFVAGSSSKLGSDRAAELWEEICNFGSYAFNYSHAVQYGMISYMTAWLKLKFPLQFAVAQLRNAADDEQIKALLRELTEEGYKYVPFDLRNSADSWSVLDDVLYGGFDSIRGIGAKTAERLVALRARCSDDDNGNEFLSKLTQAQRDRVEKAELRWTSLSHFTENYGDLYKDPGAWRGGEVTNGIKPPVYRIRDIPDVKGNYAFLGRVIKRNVVDDDAPERVAKRDGVKRGKDNQFINLTIEDDTGELGATINRFRFERFRWIAEDDISGKDFLFRGNVIEAGRRWVFIEKIMILQTETKAA